MARAPTEMIHSLTLEELARLFAARIAERTSRERAFSG
jgi:hypothetical protein